MRFQTAQFLTLFLVAALVGGCAVPQWRRKEIEPQAPAPAGASQAVKEYDRALGLIAELRYEEAAEILQGVINPLDEAGDVRRASEGFFWLGYCREKQHMLDIARNLYARLIAVYPGTAAAQRAQQRLARINDGTTG